MSNTDKTDGRYTTTTVFQVWDDRTGDRLEVREDSDCVGLVQLCSINSKGAPIPDIMATPEQMLLFAEAIVAYCKLKA